MMIDFRLIQSERGEIWRYAGTELPDGWHWYTEAVKPGARVAGTFNEQNEAAIQELVQQTSRAEDAA